MQAELTHKELGAALREHAYLEGDFVLRSGRRSRYYLDKYRFETRPDLLGPLGERIAQVVAEHEPEAVRLAGPELGAVPLAAAASLARSTALGAPAALATVIVVLVTLAARLDMLLVAPAALSRASGIPFAAA